MNHARPIHVLFYLHNTGSGGVERAMRTLAANIDRGRFEVTAVVPGEGPLTEELRGLGMETAPVPVEWWVPHRSVFGERHYYRFLAGLPERIGRLVELIREREIDVVHTDTLTSVDGALAAKAANVPHVWHIHGTYAPRPEDPFQSYFSAKELFGIVNALSAQVVAVSETVKIFLSEYIPSRVIEVIHNGIDFPEGAEPSGIRDEFPALAGKQLVALIGRIERVKGVEDYVEAGLQVLGRRPESAFLLVGGTEDEVLETRLRQSIAASAHGDRFILTGRRTDVPGILREADLVVSASVREGFGLSILEAMAAGKAVVATRSGGAEEVVVDGETGFLVSAGDAVALAGAIDKALSDPTALAEMGRKGRERALSEFSAREMARRFETVYERLAGSQTVRPADEDILAGLMLKMAGNFGAMGSRVLALERDVRDLRSFEAAFKENAVYRTVRRLAGVLRKPAA